MDRRLRVKLTEKESSIISPFSPRLPPDKFLFTFRQNTMKLPFLKPIQHRHLRRVSSQNNIVSPKELKITSSIKSLLNLRRFSNNIGNENLRKEERL